MSVTKSILKDTGRQDGLANNHAANNGHAATNGRPITDPGKAVLARIREIGHEPHPAGDDPHQAALSAEKPTAHNDSEDRSNLIVIGRIPNGLCGYPTEADVTRELTHAGQRAGLLDGEIALTLRDGLNHDKTEPLPWPDKLNRPSVAPSDGQPPAPAPANEAAAPGDGLVSFLENPPQPRPVRAELHPVPELDEWLIPEPLRPWLKDIAERASCPLDLPAISALISIATVVGRQCAIRPKRFDDWTVVPNLWGAGVLPPSELKTYCLGEPKKPLIRLEREAQERHAKALTEHAVKKKVAEARGAAIESEMKAVARKLKKGASQEDRENQDAELMALATEALPQPDSDPPTPPRYVVNDATVEKLGALLAENPRGLLQFRDELTGFLYSLEKEGHENDRPFYLEAWNGTESYSYDRIARGTLIIPSTTVSILGGIQPGRLAGYIRSSASAENNDGLISRFQLLVYPDTDRPYRHVDRLPDAAAKELAWGVFKALDSLDPVARGAQIDTGDAKKIPYLRFAPDAQEFFDGWFIDLMNRLRSTSTREPEALRHHLSKYRSLLPSLALLFHLIEVVADSASGPVSLTSAQRAAAWCGYLEAHARRVYQLAFDGDPEPAQRLAERIKSSLPNPFTVRHVTRKGWASLDKAEDVEKAVTILEEHGWVYRHEVPPGPKGGRPTAMFHVNPLAQGGK
jgi:Protein of unknown function (DUF3987)